MQVTIDDLGSTARVVLSGRLDITGADKVALPLATVAGAKDTILVDMSGVTFIASIGLRHLVLAAKAVARRGGSLKLINPSSAVVEVVTAAGLAEILPIEQRG
jgi:anti-sigma B factor antagonist